MTSGGPVICSFEETQKKELTNANKKTLTEHYENIFQQIKMNFSPKNHQHHQSIQTPCFGTTTSFTKITMKNQNKTNPHQRETFQNVPNLAYPSISTKITQNKTEMIASPFQKTENFKTQQNQATNGSSMKKTEIKNEIVVVEPTEKVEKVKRGKKIENTEVGYSTEADSQMGVHGRERKEFTKKGKLNILEKQVEEEKKNEKKRWNQNEDKQLIQAYENFCTSSKKINKWDYIASHLGERNPSQCKQRYKRLIKPENVRKKWNEAEDKILKTAVEVDKLASWELIAEKLKALGFPRTGKQVRERYKNHLDPAINLEPFKLEEDLLILNLYKVYQNKWSKIAKHLINRSENAVKNRFHYHLKKNFALDVKEMKIDDSSVENKVETGSLSEEELLPEIDDKKYLELMGMNYENNYNEANLIKGFSMESEKAHQDLKNVENNFDFFLK